jgi:hypothetical protein
LLSRILFNEAGSLSGVGPRFHRQLLYIHGTNVSLMRLIVKYIHRSGVVVFCGSITVFKGFIECVQTHFPFRGLTWLLAPLPVLQHALLLGRIRNGVGLALA